jgi:hypothetical protein
MDHSLKSHVLHYSSMLYIPVRVSSLLIFRCVALPSVDIVVIVNLLGCIRMEAE